MIDIHVECDRCGHYFVYCGVPVTKGGGDSKEYAEHIRSLRETVTAARAEFTAATARAEAAEAKLSLVDRYGAEQWRRGRDQDPQEFDEWLAQQGEVQP